MDSTLDWISGKELANLTGAHADTARRWKQAARGGLVPLWLRLLVDTIHRGILDAIHPTWRGWRIHSRDGELVSPEGLCITQGQVRALPQLYALRQALEVEVRQLRAQLQSSNDVRATRPAPAPRLRPATLHPPHPDHGAAGLQ